jgi:hypothetical protein
MRQQAVLWTRRVCVCLALLWAGQTGHVAGQAQRTLIKSSSGLATFFSDAPLEDISARSEALQGVVEPSTGRIAVQVAIRSFRFPNALMEEHFNENYLDSQRFPQARFEGSTAQPLQMDNLPESVDVVGTLTLHGVTRPLTARVRWLREGTVLTATSSIRVRVADYGIEVPRLLYQKIAEQVDVTLRLTFAAPAAK